MFDQAPVWLVAILAAFNLFATFWLFGYFTRGIARRVIGADQYDRLTKDPTGKKRARQRSREMQAAFSNWKTPSELELADWISHTSIADRRGRPYGEIIGAMPLAVDEYAIQAVDWKLMARACLRFDSDRRCSAAVVVRGCGARFLPTPSDPSPEAALFARAL